MEYQKITNLLDDSQIKLLNLEQKIGLKKMMNQEKNTMMINKSNLKQQC